MQMSGIPFGTTDWSNVERTEHHGQKGHGLLANPRIRKHSRSNSRLHAK